MSDKSYGYNDGYGNSKGHISARGLLLRNGTSEDKSYGYGYISVRGLVLGNGTSRCPMRATVTMTVTVTVTVTSVFGISYKGLAPRDVR